MPACLIVDACLMVLINTFLPQSYYFYFLSSAETFPLIIHPQPQISFRKRESLEENMKTQNG